MAELGIMILDLEAPPMNDDWIQIQVNSWFRVIGLQRQTTAQAIQGTGFDESLNGYRYQLLQLCTPEQRKQVQDAQSAAALRRCSPEPPQLARRRGAGSE